VRERQIRIIGSRETRQALLRCLQLVKGIHGQGGPDDKSSGKNGADPKDE
jgi:hypothetical protein